MQQVPIIATLNSDVTWIAAVNILKQIGRVATPIMPGPLSITLIRHISL